MNLSLIQPEPDESPDPAFWGDAEHRTRVWGHPHQESSGRPARQAGQGRPGWSALVRWADWPARRGHEWLRRRHITRQQQAVALLMAAACLGGAAWYVAGVAANDGRSFTGAVSGNGVIDLDFARAGQVAMVFVRVGQKVSRGQLLATEVTAAATAVVAADKAAIQADQVTVAQVYAQSSLQSGVNLAAAQARLAKDKAQLAVEQAAVAGMRIVAPMGGTVIAVNGQAGESAAAEPVIMLRTSRNWQVEIVVPQNSTSAVKPGHEVTIDVPADHLSGVHGRIEGLLPTPVRTAQGVGYQVLITVLGQHFVPPLNGMLADVQLGS